MRIDARAAWVTWSALSRSQWRETPGRVLATVLAIALGVALGAAVYLVNGAALQEFDRSTRRLVGNADLIVRAPASGFDQAWFVKLLQQPEVAAASPLLELQAALPEQPEGLKLLALDPFRAAILQPTLMAELAGDVTRLFAHDAVVLSSTAAQRLHRRAGDTLHISVNGAFVTLRIIDVLPDSAYSEPLALMDLGAAQWTLGTLGRLNRIDLQLRGGVNVERWRRVLAGELPAGLIVESAPTEVGRAASATRAYRVNLNMLALVALLTGGFVVFSTQTLSVLRRRSALGLLRALGVTRTELQAALLTEGALLGFAGALLGVLLGALLAALILRWVGTDLGNRQLSGIAFLWSLPPGAVVFFILLGTAVAAAGAYLPAREAAQRPPALALKAGDVEPVLQRLPTTLPGVTLLLLGATMAWLRPVAGIPLPGYIAIAQLLIGSVLLVPALLHAVLRHAPRTGHTVADTALAQLQGSAGICAVSVASIIVSFSLMVAMSIMVHSFRTSFEEWLIKLLPATLQLRAAPGTDTAVLSPLQQQHLAQLPGVTRVESRAIRPFYWQDHSAPVTLIARDIDAKSAGDVLPLLEQVAVPASATPVWISQTLQDLYGLKVGQTMELPLAGRPIATLIAGVWRDYVRAGGAVVMPRASYVALTGDATASEMAFWIRPDMPLARVQQAIRIALPDNSAFELIGGTELRERSLQLFDQAFIVTYALEAIAVLIGLVGVSVSASGTALARRAQFGMLRHIGLLRRQVLAMLATEGVTLGLLSVLYGLVLGMGLSLILVYVINRQSFHWSIELSIPWSELGLLSAGLILAAALAAVWSGRAAMSHDAVRAVREDW